MNRESSSSLTAALAPTAAPAPALTQSGCPAWCLAEVATPK